MASTLQAKPKGKSSHDHDHLLKEIESELKKRETSLDLAHEAKSKNIVDRLKSCFESYEKQSQTRAKAHETARKAIEDAHSMQMKSVQNQKNDLEAKLVKNEEEISNAKAEMQAMETKWAEEKSEMTSQYTTECKQLKEQLDDAHTEMETSSRKFEEERVKLKSVQKEKNDLEDKLVKNEEEISNAKAEMQAMETKWAEEKSEMTSQYTTECKQLKEQLDDAHTEMETSSRKFEEERMKLKSDHDKEITELQEKLNEIQQEFANEREALQSASTKAADEHKTEVKELEEKHSHTEQELKHNTEKFQKLEDELLQLRNETENLMQEKKALENDGYKQKQTFEEQLAKSTTQIQGLEHEVNEQKTRVLKLTQHLEEETKLKDRYQEQLNTKEQRLDDMVAELKTKEEELKTIREQLHTTEEQLREQETKREESQRSLEEIKKMHKKAETHSTKSTADLDSYFDQVTDLCEKLSAAESEAKNNEKEMKRLNELVGRAERIEVEYLEATTKLSELEDELKQLRTNIPAALQQSGDTESTKPRDSQAGRTVQKLKKEIADLKEKLEERDEELHNLKSKQGDNPLNNPPFSPTESMKVSSSEVQDLKLKLKEKEQDLQNIRTQIHSMESDLQERDKLKKASSDLKEEIAKLYHQKKTLTEHAKTQSQKVWTLTQQLETSQVRYRIIETYIIYSNAILFRLQLCMNQPKFKKT